MEAFSHQPGVFWVRSGRSGCWSCIRRGSSGPVWQGCGVFWVRSGRSGCCSYIRRSRTLSCDSLEKYSACFTFRLGPPPLIFAFRLGPPHIFFPNDFRSGFRKLKEQGGGNRRFGAGPVPKSLLLLLLMLLLRTPPPPGTRFYLHKESEQSKSAW